MQADIHAGSIEGLILKAIVEFIRNTIRDKDQEKQSRQRNKQIRHALLPTSYTLSAGLERRLSR